MNEIKITSKEYKQAIDFMSDMHSSILKAKDKVIAFLKRKGFDEMADELSPMSKIEFKKFIEKRVYEQKIRKQIRTILSEILKKVKTELRDLLTQDLTEYVVNDVLQENSIRKVIGIYGRFQPAWSASL